MTTSLKQSVGMTDLFTDTPRPTNVPTMNRHACIALCTCPDIEVAEQLAEQLVIRHLAACVNVLPGIRSIYRWQGQVERANEVQLVIKTRQNIWPQLEQFILHAHPYETPELIAVPITAGLPAYLEWLENTCE